ncbi:MAG: D-alanine--D-alanine ligase [Ardenticatenaceae bacterium]|nr:MAG: D-alanine--D-alanine ligase [Ardenticatenaceae bacterium]
MRALNPNKYDVIPIGIDKNGRWLTGDVVGTLIEGKPSSHPATLLPVPQAAGVMQLNEGESVGITSTLSVIEGAVSQLDVIFPVLHGPYGEDGTVQGLLELANLPYVGAGVVGSAVGMDKAIFKHVMTANGLPILPWLMVQSSEWRKRPYKIIEQVEAILVYPVFTKPANLGSSVGICKCNNREELEAGLNEAASYDRRIVVEQGVNVRELEVSVLGNDEPVASVVGEVRPRRDFYDYVAKYVSDDSELIIPADLTEAQSDEVRHLAVQAYRAIDCAGLGRVDLLMDVDNGRLYLNEINTIPGFTQISMYPKLWEATGLPYSQLLDKLINLAIERHEEKERLKTTIT